MLDKPLIDRAPAYTFEDIKAIESEKDTKVKKRKLNIKKSKSEAYPDVIMYDVKLNARGITEDQYYLSYIDLLKNIRRGNTYLEFTGKDGEKKITVGRKGMIKFYDISRDMLVEGAETESVSKESGDNKKTEDRKQYFTTMNVTLAGPYKALKEGYKVEAVRTLKANGENAQVAWDSELDMWIFCSKNVALLAKTEDDIEKYSSSEEATRYTFAIIIAKAWFGKLAVLGDKAEDLKKDLAGKTLIGEYCGDPEHLHLIFYPKIKIIFYTIVDNYSEYSCMLPEESYRLFKKYGLECVTLKSLGVFSNYEDLKDCLKATYKEVARERIDTGEEGSVIYLVRRSETGADDRILSLAKMKTLEYRLYRKLREKTKTTINAINKKGGPESSEKQAWNSMVKKFKTEANDLNRDPDSKDGLLDEAELERYISLAEIVAKKLYEHPEFQSTCRDSYLTFLRDVINPDDAAKLVSRIFDIQEDIEYIKPEI